MTDRLESYSAPCPCGHGKVRIVHASPDHMWAGSSWQWETSLDCSVCEQTLMIEGQGNDFFLRLREVVAARDAAYHRLFEAKQALMVSPAVQQLFADLDGHLGTMRTKVMRFEFLKRVRLISESQGTFNRKWPYNGHWSVHLKYDFAAITKVLAAMQRRDPEVVAGLQVIDAMEAQFAADFPKPPPEEAFFRGMSDGSTRP